MKMKTILVDGNWNLKRNFKRSIILDAYGNNCGGTLGFVKSLRTAINRVLPDRIVVAWDGHRSGILRHSIYPPYKANRNKDWDNEERIYSGDFKSFEDKEKYDFLIQKINTQNILEELFVRQMEVDLIEADDLIAGYVQLSEWEQRDEHIVLFSRDKDFKQFISDRVSVMTPDSVTMITPKNFKEKNGYILENELLVRCFEGDVSDSIEGVKGITVNQLSKYFPDFCDRKYTYQDLFNRAMYMINEEKNKSKTLQKIVDSKNVLYRNAQLMNLKKPFLNDQALEEIRRVTHLPMDDDRSIKRLIQTFMLDGYIDLIKQDGIDIGSFFSPFYRIMSKELDFKKSLKK